jgi:hypothetical protein
VTGELCFRAVEEVGDAFHVELGAFEKGRFGPAQSCGTVSSGRHDETALSKRKKKIDYFWFFLCEGMFLSVLRFGGEIELKVEAEVLSLVPPLTQKNNVGRLTGYKI